jgi:tripartite-type tricarboxylate transporter receptor subunit TctC
MQKSTKCTRGRFPILKHTRRRHLAFIGAALAMPALPRQAPAQVWPSKPIRAIVPFTPGSTIDIVARIVLDALSQQLGQSIIVENRGGAGGTIGAAMAARAEPDGYTVLAHSSAHVTTPAIYPNAPYDTARDFVAVAALGSSANIMVVAPDKGFKTPMDLVATAKQKAGGMTFGTAGVGSSTHFTTERFRFSAGFEGVHVPFRGMPEVLTEVMTGRVDFCFSTIAAALPFIRDGKLVALAVSTPKRSSALPDVPTTLELGYANSDYTFWNGLFLPAKTPREIVERLHQEAQKAATLPAVREKLAQQGIDPMPITPAEFDALVRKEIDESIALVKAAGIKVN